MTKFIVVNCRGSHYRIFEDMTRVAQAKIRRKLPPIPSFNRKAVKNGESEGIDPMDVYSKEAMYDCKTS